MADADDWEHYRTFLGVLEHASLSAAARALGLAQPTVGRHVAALEKSLGLSLFTRSPSGLLPTEAALELRRHAEAMRSHAAALRRTAAGSGGSIAGSVRVSASEVVGIEVLPPILARLQAEHPRLAVELVLSNRVQDLLQREADIAVRMTPPQQEQLVARKVGEIELGLYAHTDYLQRRGMPQTTAELRAHALIGFDEETPFLRAAKRWLPVWERAAFALRADSDVAQLALIRAGAGIGICQTALAARDARLVRVLPDQFAIPLPTWLVMHEDLRQSARCRVTFDALAQGLLAYTGA
ncbi:MAG TPA: LysR substrate-binding domain-containing protein [Tahibacter sp.]|nr:LysR substrate-binding domain-containing protein [Tahibacter sp.]